MNREKGEYMPDDRIALSILNRHYGMASPELTRIQNEPVKAVWKVTDGGGTTYILKSDYRRNGTAVPSIVIQHALSAQGLQVPAVIRTTSHKLSAGSGDHLFFLSQYIEGEPSSVPERANAIGRFHRSAVLPGSLSSHPRIACQRAGSENWIADYETKFLQLKKWASVYALEERMRHCLHLARKCLKLAGNRAALLDEHSKLVGERKWLVHGDLTGHNALRTGAGQLWLIDLELARVDSPIKDIRFLQPRMVLSSLYEGYFDRFAPGKPFEDLYYLDAVFPHGLYLYISGMIRKRKLPLNLPELQSIIDNELEKNDRLSNLLGGPH